MKAYGYSDKNKFVELTEVSLECTLDELKEITEFLIYANELNNSNKCKDEYCHSHYRDWTDKFDEKSSDLIIITNIDKCK